MVKPIKLARREREIIHLAVAGKAPKEIASALELAPKTVNTRMLRLARRLGLSTRQEVIVWALQHPFCLVRGQTVDPGLHPAGCSCDSPYCQVMRSIPA